MNTVEIFSGRRHAFPRHRHHWYVRLMGANGETLATSEAYSTKWNAKRAARKNFPGLEIKEVPS